MLPGSQGVHPGSNSHNIVQRTALWPHVAAGRVDWDCVVWMLCATEPGWVQGHLGSSGTLTFQTMPFVLDSTTHCPPHWPPGSRDALHPGEAACRSQNEAGPRPKVGLFQLELRNRFHLTGAGEESARQVLT